FGAIVLLNTLQNTGAVDRINQGFRNISADMRVQIVIVSFLFGAIIEVVAGFGTPAALTGPLMMALGFKPMAAATIALNAHRAHVMCCVVGRSLVFCLRNIPYADIALFKEVCIHITTLDLFAGTIIPFTIVVILTKFFGKTKSLKEALPLLPWT